MNNKLVKIAKALYKIFSGVQVAALFAGVLTVALAIGAIIKLGKKTFGLRTVSFGALELTFMNNAESGGGNDYLMMILLVVGVIVICVMSLFFFSTLCSILEPMKEGKPFESGVSKQIRKLGIVVLVHGIVVQLLYFLLTYLPFATYDVGSFFDSESVLNYSYKFRPDVSFIFFSLVIFLLSYVFKYGEQLQRESDETL